MVLLPGGSFVVVVIRPLLAVKKGANTYNMLCWPSFFAFLHLPAAFSAVVDFPYSVRVRKHLQAHLRRCVK